MSKEHDQAALTRVFGVDDLIQGESAIFCATGISDSSLLPGVKLTGHKATTHWAFIPCLKQFPKIKVVEGYPRFVVDRNRVTGGGISSGLDAAFKLVELLAGYEAAQAVQRTTKQGMEVSIHDPGNAELVITVGSTDREMPHMYGVSYFSSKGPTLDGRLKPDLVAPGEWIVSCAAGVSATKLRENHGIEAGVANAVVAVATSSAKAASRKRLNRRGAVDSLMT